ncbi:winged helix-turn-helix transcriptional regulator [Deinococcus aestuarii]|uniref:winged helix-turn-helix transcriptional regulator n=1 Tax=Deinococcus aestuarii TaxID=2774531 RepID=UPI001C0B73AC|nr:helix-turn-helix domain-containing protein [Deinococcus aestuarii]
MTKGEKLRSGCPVSLGLDIFGDRWTLLIIRDLMFTGKQHFREMLQSEEGISSNILADRLQLLLAEGIITKAEDPGHRQKVVYSLTEKGIDLLPILMQISHWSYKYRPVGEAYLGVPEAGNQEDQSDWGERKAVLQRQHLPSPGQEQT